MVGKEVNTRITRTQCRQKSANDRAPKHTEWGRF